MRADVLSGYVESELEHFDRDWDRYVAVSDQAEP